MANKSEGDGNGVLKLVGWVVLLASGTVGCGVELALLKLALEKSETNGIIAYLPFATIGIIGMLKGYTSIQSLISTEE